MLRKVFPLIGIGVWENSANYPGADLKKKKQIGRKGWKWLKKELAKVSIALGDVSDPNGPKAL